ncbi:glycoside hydrolase family 128 protein [Cucurbitaria berberidis CBS 394.84]|uniref:Glycoside hydrolase family 128 protein n=1 Tax=Cucurbitaria berberidis CBS 394.84 TaxID=1168544 RepID=A0A9P4L378_9PLEO|nr:glycoside hydrolase family 128 protein [Cucurbitaria berberidis CBS 394.84]KAF1839974.1 glycoside hydrolase family 128 protein [Cucurbitaria berberidis CBS 394.84]
MLKSTFFLTLAGLSTLMEATPLKPRGGGKRGLAFPKQYSGTAGSQYTHSFAGCSKVTWMYDWEAVIDGDAISLEYVPLLHSNEAWCTEGWFNNIANAQKKYQVSHVLAFNEPDQTGGGGTNMAVGDAVAAYRKYIQPLAKQGLRLGSPAVTNGNEANKGINWLKQFVAGCSDCQIDFVVAHYYAWDKAEDFKNYLKNFHQTFNKPLWVTEFGVTEGNADAFLAQVLPWLDSQDWIERYAYHMVAPSSGSQWLINAAGSGLSSTGQVYASA